MQFSELVDLATSLRASLAVWLTALAAMASAVGSATAASVLLARSNAAAGVAVKGVPARCLRRPVSVHNARFSAKVLSGAGAGAATVPKGHRATVMAVATEKKARVQRITYKGWHDAIEIVNDDCGLVVVPSIGRVMYYGWHGQNIIWEEPALEGVTLKPTDQFRDWGEWRNFGGDKVWPNEQADFDALLGRNGPPDEYFDGGAHTSQILPDGCTITSKISKYNGARITREFRLAPQGTRVDIKQTLEYVTDKQHSKPFTIWNITQVKQTEQVLYPLNPHSFLPNQYKAWDDVAPKNWSTDNGIGVFLTDPSSMQKTGADSDRWIAGIVGDTVIVEFFRRDSTFKFPDGGMSAECCTFPNYTELEILSPLIPLSPGDKMSFSIAWELARLPYNSKSAADKRAAAVDWIRSKLYHYS